MKTVKSILDKKGNAVLTIESGKTVSEAVKAMTNAKVGSILVFEKNTLKGIFTERDVLNKVVAKDIDVNSAKVDDFMSTDLITCDTHDTIEEVSRIMSSARKRHIPVVEKGKLIGLVTSGDIMASVLEDRKIEIEHLHNYIQGNVTT
jgi:CBS domain-containing protein